MKKYRQNIKQSWKLLIRNRLFSVVSILTTAVTITYLMVLWMGYMFHNSNMAPEDKRDRTMHLTGLAKYKKNSEKSSADQEYIKLNVDIVKQVIAPLKGAELIVVNNDLGYVRSPTTIRNHSTNERIKLWYSIANENVWNQFSYKFIEGRPFTKEEVESGLNVAVISRSTARKLFHETENIVGRVITPEFSQKTFRVVGVVEDISALFSDAFAQIWMPFPNNQQECGVDIIRKQGVTKEELEAEIIENFVKYSQAQPTENYKCYWNYGRAKKMQKLFIFISLILLIVPAVNGMGLVASNISERTSEIGIRKAYGASRVSIIRQLLYENMLSTGIGGVIGMICSMLITICFGELLLVQNIGDVSRELFTLSFSSLFDIRIFTLAMLFCFIFNIMSVYIPAIRATRTSIADAVKGGEL